MRNHDTKYFEGVCYTGVGSIEFKKNDKDDRFTLMELNPRLWLQNIQASCAEINFPYINYLDCTGEKINPVLNYKKNITWINLKRDYKSFKKNRTRGDISFFNLFKSVLSADCFAYLSLDDLVPLWEKLKYR